MTGVQTCALPIFDFDKTRGNKETMPGYSKFLKNLLALIKNYISRSSRAEEFKTDFRIYHKEIQKIARAAYVAIRTWDGYDLHFGNLGYFVNNPNTYFYFDM